MKKIISILCITTMFLYPNIFVYATANKDTINIKTIEINNGETLYDDFISKNKKNDVDLISIKSLEKSKLEDIYEILDNGTDIFVRDDNIDYLASKFNTSFLENKGSSIYLGSYIQTSGTDYNVTPVMATVVDDDGNVIEISDTESIEKIKNDYDLNDIYEKSVVSIDSYKDLSNILMSNQNSLQTITDLGNSFKDFYTLFYFYKKGSASGISTDYIYSRSETLSGYTKIGSAQILAYAIKLKTDGTTTYDYIYTKATASGLNDKYVDTYTHSIEIESTYGSIIDASQPDGGANESLTASIGNSISSDGKATITNTLSYTYNPDGQSIVPALGEKNIKRWTAKPKSNIKNKSWSICPAILIKNTKGTTTYTTVNMRMDTLKVRSSILRSYTIKSGFVLGLSITNHT